MTIYHGHFSSKTIAKSGKCYDDFNCSFNSAKFAFSASTTSPDALLTILFAAYIDIFEFILIDCK